MAWPNRNTDHWTVSHFQFSTFWTEEQVFHFFHWKDSAGCLTFLVSLAIYWFKDLLCSQQVTSSAVDK